MGTVYVTHDRYRAHDMLGYRHPEHSGRIAAVWQEFSGSGLLGRLDVRTPQAVTDEMILRVHSKAFLEKIQWAEQQQSMILFDSDTYCLPESVEIARLSAGGVITAIDAVMTGTASNALAAVRPPGHHATPDSPMGFCILSNIAIGARYAQAAYGVERVMIVDYDVHHGNGTQDIFYEDSSVLFVSTHQYPFYPGSGALRDTGRGAGAGTTANIPLPAGHGDTSYAAIYKRFLIPLARRFRPQLILVSAGFDAHHVDPIAMMRLTHPGYALLSRELKLLADELCGGKIVFVMEGGYDVTALAHGMRNVAHVLLGEDNISDPYGSAPGHNPDAARLIDQLLEEHGF